jgi:c-di-GMP-binding flagellar brake protein YcgR
MPAHGLTLIAPIPGHNASMDDDGLDVVQFPNDKQPRSISKLDAFIGAESKKANTRHSVVSDDTTEVTDSSLTLTGNESATVFTYETHSTTTTRAKIENEGTVSFFLSELGNMFSEPFSEETLMEQGYMYEGRDEQTVESQGLDSNEEKEDNHDDDERKYSLNFRTIPATQNRSDLSAIFSQLERDRSNISTSLQSQAKQEGLTEEMPICVENNPQMAHSQVNESNDDEVVNGEQGDKNDDEDEDEDDTEYSLNFHNIPIKSRRSDLATIIAKIDRRHSKNILEEPASARTTDSCNAHVPKGITSEGVETDSDYHQKTKLDSNETGQKKAFPRPKITVLEEESQNSSNTQHDFPSKAPEEKECKEAMVQPDHAVKRAGEEGEKEASTVLSVPAIPKHATSTEASLSGETEETSDDSPARPGTEYQGFACFALFHLCADSKEEDTLHFIGRAIMDEDDKDIDLPSIECILQEASGVRMCTAKRGARVKVRAYRGRAKDKKLGLVKVFLSARMKASQNVQL